MKFLPLAILILFIIPLVSAESFKQNEDVEIRHSIRIDGAPSENINANITIRDPDRLTLIGFEEMTYNSTFYEYNYTLARGKVNKLGTYSYTITATGNGLNETSEFEFEVTPNGQEGLLGFFFLIIGMAYMTVFFGIYKRDVTITMLGTFALYFLGLWILFFGLDVFKNYLTNGFALITLGIAFYISVRAAHEYIV